MRTTRVWVGMAALGVLTLGACSPAPEGNGAAESETEAAEPATSESPAAEATKLEGAALAEALSDEGIFLLDVREPSELEELGTVEGYVNIPIDQLADRLDELPKDKPILTA